LNLEEDTWQYKRSIYFLKVERDLLGNKSLFVVKRDVIQHATLLKENMLFIGRLVYF